MTSNDSIREPELERHGRRFGRSAGRFFGIAAAPVIAGVLLVILTSGWAYDLGWVILVLGLLPAVVGVGLLLSSVVARWSARHKQFA